MVSPLALCGLQFLQLRSELVWLVISIYTYSEEPAYRLTRARCAFSLRLYSTTLKDARQALDSLRGRRAAMDETLHALSPTLRRGVAQHNAQQYLEGFRWLVKGLIAKGNFSEETFKGRYQLFH